MTHVGRRGGQELHRSLVRTSRGKSLAVECWESGFKSTNSVFFGSPLVFFSGFFVAYFPGRKRNSLTDDRPNDCNEHPSGFNPKDLRQGPDGCHAGQGNALDRGLGLGWDHCLFVHASGGLAETPGSKGWYPEMLKPHTCFTV